jgi:hypothetical protein
MLQLAACSRHSPLGTLPASHMSLPLRSRTALRRPRTSALSYNRIPARPTHTPPLAFRNSVRSTARRTRTRRRSSVRLAPSSCPRTRSCQRTRRSHCTDRPQCTPVGHRTADQRRSSSACTSSSLRCTRRSCKGVAVLVAVGVCRARAREYATALAKRVALVARRARHHVVARLADRNPGLVAEAGGAVARRIARTHAVVCRAATHLSERCLGVDAHRRAAVARVGDVARRRLADSAAAHLAGGDKLARCSSQHAPSLGSQSSSGASTMRLPHTDDVAGVGAGVGGASASALARNATAHASGERGARLGDQTPAGATCAVGHVARVVERESRPSCRDPSAPPRDSAAAAGRRSGAVGSARARH